MACPTVSKFLCCITLETGGLIMGWLTVLFSLLFIGYMGIALALAISLFNDSSPLFPDDNYLSTGVFIFLVAVFSIAVLYFLILLGASVMLIRGTKTRDHTKLMPFMILMCIGIVICALQMIASGAAAIVVAIIMLIIVIYFYLCVYSLYNKLRNEKTNPPQMQPYAQPVIYATPYQAQPGVQQVQATHQYPQFPVYPAAQPTLANQSNPSAPV